MTVIRWYVLKARVPLRVPRCVWAPAWRVPLHLVRLAVGVLEPDLAVARPVALALRGVAVRWADHRGPEVGRALECAVEVGDFPEPHQDAVADIAAVVGEQAVVVLDVPVVELEHEDVVGEQALVLRSAVVAAQAEELLVPAAGCLDVADAEQCLGLGGAGRGDDADPVACGVVDLSQPAFAVVRPGAATDPAAGRLDPLQRG